MRPFGHRRRVQRENPPLEANWDRKRPVQEDSLESHGRTGQNACQNGLISCHNFLDFAHKPPMWQAKENSAGEILADGAKTNRAK
jgi:hypothetical protein